MTVHTLIPPFLAPIEAQVGDEFIYTMLVHASVGIQGDVKKEDPQDCLVLIEDRVAYHYPERMKEQGITGADEATWHLRFKAIRTGIAILRMEHLFRGELEASYSAILEIC